MAALNQPPPGDLHDPSVDQASPARWRARLQLLLTNGRERLAALGIVLVLGFLFGVLALVFFADLSQDMARGDTMALDTAVLVWLRQFQGAVVDVLARAASAMGSEVLAVVGIGVLGILVARRRWGAAIGLVVTTVGAQLMNNVLKDMFQRTRPAPVVGLIPAQSFSFPSGHAMVSAAFYGYLAYLCWRILKGKQRWVALIGLLVLVVLIGLSRMYLGVHYLTDVVAGYIAGFIWVDAVIIGGHLLTLRRRRRGAVSTETVPPLATVAQTSPTAPADPAPADATPASPTAPASLTTPASPDLSDASPAVPASPGESAPDAPRRPGGLVTGATHAVD
jgi:undecaprenyl-diphosphatase